MQVLAWLHGACEQRVLGCIMPYRRKLRFQDDDTAQIILENTSYMELIIRVICVSQSYLRINNNKTKLKKSHRLSLLN